MRVKLITQSPTGRNRVEWLHWPVAWYAARGIALWTHCAVILYGTYGTARFNTDGSGVVAWNDKSTTPGAETRFGENTTVCIN